MTYPKLTFDPEKIKKKVPQLERAIQAVGTIKLGNMKKKNNKNGKNILDIDIDIE